MGKSGRDYTREEDGKKRMRETVAAYQLTAITTSESKDMDSDFMCFQRGFRSSRTAPPPALSFIRALSPPSLFTPTLALTNIPMTSCSRHLSPPPPLYGGKVGGLIWIIIAAEALRFSFAKSSRPPLKMWKCKVKLTIISRFKLIQVFAKQKYGIHGPLSDVVHVNRGAITSTKSLHDW